MNIKKLVYIVLPLLMFACASSNYGKKMKDPYSGSKYESNNRFWRGTGKAESIKENIARSKADLQAKEQLASQVGTKMKAVADQYLSQNENEVGFDVADKFESLTRQVMNTNLADMRKIGQEKYYNDETKKYTVFVAYEIKKAAMLRFMKKQAKLDAKINDAERKAIEDIIDDELKKVEE